MLKKWIRSFLDAILPEQCYLCSAFSSPPFCPECQTKLVPRLRKTADPSGRFNVWSFFAYNGPVKTLLTPFKFDSRQDIGDILAKKIPLESPSFTFGPIDYWIPVPLHPKKLKSRGFNQVNSLFRSYVKERNSVYIEGVHRVKNTPPLYDLTRDDREKTLSGAFKLDASLSLSGKRIALLDDIYTTGSTVREIAKLLWPENIASLDVITLAIV